MGNFNSGGGGGGAALPILRRCWVHYVKGIPESFAVDERSWRMGWAETDGSGKSLGAVGSHLHYLISRKVGIVATLSTHTTQAFPRTFLCLEIIQCSCDLAALSSPFSNFSTISLQVATVF